MLYIKAHQSDIWLLHWAKDVTRQAQSHQGDSDCNIVFVMTQSVMRILNTMMLFVKESLSSPVSSVFVLFSTEISKSLS